MSFVSARNCFYFICLFFLIFFMFFIGFMFCFCMTGNTDKKESESYDL